MANRWVEFVRKWAKDNNMNYMCAMTTKECKDAYLKAYPKPIPGGLKGIYSGDPDSIDVDGLLDMISGLLSDLSNLGTDGWSGSNDSIIKLAKKHKVNISKFLSKEDAGWYQEYDTVENLLDGFKGKNYSKKAHFFLQDLFELLEGYRNKGEQVGMAEADTPAPASAPAKKVVSGNHKVLQLSYDIDDILNDLELAGNELDGSLDKVKAVAKKHKVSIDRFIKKKKSDSLNLEYILEGVRHMKSEKVYLFLKDFYDIAKSYESSPAPAPPAKKVIIKVPKKSKKAVLGETNTQPELVKMILDDMKKKGVSVDSGEKIVLRKQKN
jgi:hypothetical protein